MRVVRGRRGGGDDDDDAPAWRWCEDGSAKAHRWKTSKPKKTPTARSDGQCAKPAAAAAAASAEAALRAKLDAFNLPAGLALREVVPFRADEFCPILSAEETVRVMQWNMLADGLADDAFLVRDAFVPLAPADAYGSESFETLVRDVADARACNGDMSPLQERLGH